MTQQLLGKIEQQRNQPFSAAEIQRLLANQAKLDAFHTELALEKWMTVDELKKALEGRLKAMEDLVYFKNLEEKLTTRVEKKLEQTSGDFREQIADLLHHVSVLDEGMLEQVRSTREQDILSGEVMFEQEKVEAYMELVREELKQQVFRIKSLTLPKPGESKDEIRDYAEKSGYLLDFIVSHGNMTTAEKNYLKAFLLQKIRSKESLSFLQELYEELQGYFQEPDPEGSRKKIQEMVKKLWEQQDKTKKKHILEVLDKHLPQLGFTAEQLNDLLSFGVRSQGDVSFDQRMALHLEEIEMALFEMELENMSTHPQKSRIDEQQKLLKQELKALEEDIDDFKQTRYSLHYSIDQLSEDTASALEKVRLKNACHFLKKHEGVNDDALKKQLESIDRSGVEAFLREAETKAETYLCETAEPAFQRESLEMLRKNAPYFDIFVIVTEQERYANRPKATPEKPSEYHEDANILQKLEDLIKVMEAEVKAQFATPGSEERFEAAQREFEKIQDETGITVTRLHYELGDDVPTDQQIQEIHEKTYLTLPAALWNRYEAATAAKDNLTRFKRSRKSIMALKNFDQNDAQLREGLAAFFADYFEVKEARGVEVNKLCKVMSLDHPITAIRFNAADKKPFDSRRGIYDFHKLDGRPVTYRQRSVALLKTVQQGLMSGDFSQLLKLFNRGEKADRLYMDSIFFPINTVKNQYLEESIVYDTTTSKDGEEVQTFTTKIPDTSDYDRLFARYKDKTSTEYKKHVEKYQGTLNDITADNLAEDEAFTQAFEESEENRKAMEAYLDALKINEDGSASIDLERFTLSTGEVAAAGLQSLEDLRIDRETLKKLQEHSPLIAGRAAQYNSIRRGYIQGGIELLGREAMDIARLPGQALKAYGKAWWKNVRFYSITSIIIAFEEFYEHVANLADFGRKFKAYNLLKNTFEGTIIGSEFYKLLQSKENERVDAFGGAFAQYGNEDIKAKLLNPRDRFELKATMIEGFDHRGLFTIEDILKNEVFDVINKFTPSYIIPKKYEDIEMIRDPEKKSEMTNHVRQALDSIWGQGTWSGWRTNGASKYEGNRKAANDNFNTLTGGEKMRTFSQWWEWLKLPDDDDNPLKKIAPAELVGSIENDMQRCNNDSGEIFAIMQALICKGYIRLEHYARLQDAHTNDLPIFALLEPEQARLSGMQEYIEKALESDLPYTMEKNPIVQFYQGKRALRLKAQRDVGKWQIPKNEKRFNELNEEKKIEEVDLTAHELQKVREPQPNFIKKMDNGVTGIYGPAYSIEKIQNALNRNAQGDIDDARDHDIVALYRGMHEKMAAYMKDLGDLDKDMDEKQFKRNVYNAYAEIGKASAFATYLAGHKNREDYDINLADGSPNYDGGKVKKSGMPEGLSAFEKLIIPNTGRAQRLNESNDTLDKMPDDDGFRDFRKKFKLMSGYQYTLGVHPVDGKKSGKKIPYDRTGYRPSAYFEEVIDAFQTYVLNMAKKRAQKINNPNFYTEISQSLDRSGMANFTLNNDVRQIRLDKWKVDEAKLD